MQQTYYNFKNGDRIITSFTCPEYSSRMGTILNRDKAGLPIYQVNINPIEKGKETKTVWIHASFLTLRRT